MWPLSIFWMGDFCGFSWLIYPTSSNYIQFIQLWTPMAWLSTSSVAGFVFKLRSRSANSAVRTSWFEPKPRCMDTLNSRNVAIHIETNISVWFAYLASLFANFWFKTLRAKHSDHSKGEKRGHRLCSMKNVPRLVTRAVMGVCPSRRRYIQMAGHGFGLWSRAFAEPRTPSRHADFVTQEMRAPLVRRVMRPGGQEVQDSLHSSDALARIQTNQTRWPSLNPYPQYPLLSNSWPACRVWLCVDLAKFRPGD